MKFSFSWLSQHIQFKPDISLEIISKSLTNLGLEVESIQDPSDQLKDFIIAKIINVSPHPNADKLNIVKVDIGDKKVSVVCGATNVKINLMVVFAPIGSKIPSNGLVLKKKDIRGYTGEGMLCSSEELGLDERSDGIIELPNNAPLGNIYAEWLGLYDPIIEIGLTPNRGDCASIRGIARELSALGLGSLIENSKPKIKGTFKSPINWDINLDSENKHACTYVAGRYFKGLKNVESPDWLKKRLYSIGLKPISALVDLTNFLTFDLGRPLHVFDANKLKGNLSIRMAKTGEKLLALDGKNYDLNKKILIISDERNILSIAGVMGGENSSCDMNTTEMFLESAYFSPKDIAFSGRNLNILSDARYRFERGVDPNFVDVGLNIMTELVLEICGGQVSEEVNCGDNIVERRQIEYAHNKVLQFTGIDIEKNKQAIILQGLGFEVSDNKDKFNLIIPSWRHDIIEEVDIVEEVLRVNGYDKLKEASLENDNFNHKKVLSYDEYRNRLVSSALVKRGLYESVTFSFLSKKDAELYSENMEPILLSNPISEDLSVLRTSLLPNIINNFIKNNNKGIKNYGLYEVGSVYLGEDDKDQILCSAGIRSGQVLERHWAVEPREFDIYDSKKDAYCALQAMSINLDSVFLGKDIPKWYHPGRAASIHLGKNILGYFGELHPKYSDMYGIKILCFELFHNNVPKSKNKKLNKDYISYSLMPLKRDFAFVTDIDTPSDDIIKSVKKALNKSINVKILSINLFDVFEKDLSSKKQKSLALEVIMQPIEKTLKDSEIIEISTLIIDGVNIDTGATLRD